MRNLAVFIAIISGFFVASNIYADTATLSVTQIRQFKHMLQQMEPLLVVGSDLMLQFRRMKLFWNMKFNNWVSGSNIIPAEGNIRFYSSHLNASTTGSAIIISATDTYSNAMNIIPGDSNDLSLLRKTDSNNVEAKFQLVRLAVFIQQAMEYNQILM